MVHGTSPSNWWACTLNVTLPISLSISLSISRSLSLLYCKQAAQAHFVQNWVCTIIQFGKHINFRYGVKRISIQFQIDVLPCSTPTHTHAYTRTLSAYAVWGVWKTQICVGREVQLMSGHRTGQRSANELNMTPHPPLKRHLDTYMQTGIDTALPGGFPSWPPNRHLIKPVART